MYDIWTTINQRVPRSWEFPFQYEEPIIVANSPKPKPPTSVNKDPEDKYSNSECDLMGSSYDYKSIICYEDIIQSLNGFARIVKYRSCPKPGSPNNPQMMEKKDLELLSMEEGVIKKGKKNGYCRVFDAQSGNVECGFFKNDLPRGKYVKWGTNQIEKMEGIYKGRTIASNVEIKSFEFNVDHNY